MFHVTDEKCNCEKDIPFQGQGLRREGGVVRKEGLFWVITDISVLKIETSYFYETSVCVYKIV
jgi:hypothetical protein